MKTVWIFFDRQRDRDASFDDRCGVCDIVRFLRAQRCVPHQSREPILRLSNQVMLSALVHKPTLPGGPGNLLSVATKSSLPSKNIVRRSSLAAMPRVCHAWPDTLTSIYPIISRFPATTRKANVIFECAGAGDVIIINRCKSDEYASGLIGFAGNCHEADRNVNVASGERPVDSKRKAIVSRIGIYLCQYSAGVVFND